MGICVYMWRQDLGIQLLITAVHLCLFLAHLHPPSTATSFDQLPASGDGGS